MVLTSDDHYYINTSVRYADRRLPKVESTLNHFIHIPTKRNIETIRNWLGVERYKINLELIDYRQLNQNKDFEQEITDIKIAALAIFDEPDNYIAIIKNLKIVPCGYILVKNAEKDNIEYDLDDYGYIKKDGKYYIKIPINAEVEQIRGTLDFRNSVTEIFEDAVRRQIDSNQFAYLLLNNGKGKKEIIKNQYGIDKWNTIYELLFQSKRLNDLIIKFFREKDLDERRLQNLEMIDFSNDLRLEEFKELKDALNAIGKDIQDINDKEDQIQMDIRPYLKAELLMYRDSHAETYRVNCYLHALENVESRKTFLEDCDKFMCYDIETSSLENTILINYEKIIKSQFNKFDPKVDCFGICVDDQYNKYYLKILKDSGYTHDDLELYLQMKSSVKSMIYFEIPENIIEDFKSFMITELEKKADNTQNDVLDGNSSIETSTVETTLSPTSTDNSVKNSGHHVKSEKSPKGYEADTVNKEKAGKKAEQIAYIELKKDYPYLIWHSKNSDVPADRHRGPVDIVCDMWNTDSNNVKTYFEIKSATTEFEMSINEYNSMQSVPDAYVIVLVDIATGEISKHKLDELEALKQVSKYKFCFKQIKKRT